MAYEYEIDKIFELFGVNFSSESRAKVRDSLWYILDNIDYEGYQRGEDSVHGCHDGECYGY